MLVRGWDEDEDFQLFGPTQDLQSHTSRRVQPAADKHGCWRAGAWRDNGSFLLIHYIQQEILKYCMPLLPPNAVADAGEASLQCESLLKTYV